MDRQRITIPAGRIVRFLLLGCAGIALLCWAMTGSLLLAALAAFLVWQFPGWAVGAAQWRRRRLFLRQFVDLLILMTNSLHAGFNISQTIEIVANEMPSPAREEFGMIQRERDLGASLEDAMESLGERMDSESVTIFVTAILVTLRTGGDLVAVLDKLVTSIRDRERVADRIRTMTSEGRTQGYVIAALPVLLLVGRYFINPEGVRSLLDSNLGLSLIVAGAVLNILGLLAIQRMSDVKV
ncbi:MAG: type II secretion system F family protein [Lentisphaerae bacterium]|nr:type II secretion system F family protein [Lentisphaerota bacterium]